MPKSRLPLSAHKKKRRLSTGLRRWMEENKGIKRQCGLPLLTLKSGSGNMNNDFISHEEENLSIPVEDPVPNIVKVGQLYEFTM